MGEFSKHEDPSFNRKYKPQARTALPVVPHPMTFSQSAGFQCFLLQCFGFLPFRLTCFSSKWTKVLSRITFALAVLLTIGGWISFGFNASVALGTLLSPDKSIHLNPIMQALTQIPFATYNFRGVIILTILLFKRKHWTEFVRLMDEVLLQTFPVITSKVAKTVRVWKVISFGGALLTLFIVVTFETLNDLQYGLMTNRGLYDTGVLDPLPLYMLVWQYETFWTVCSTLPFYLSQQMAICIYITGQILADCCKNLNRALKDESKTLTIESRDTIALHDLFISRTQKSTAETLYRDPTERVVFLKQRYLNLCEVCEYLNQHFGAVLFFLYGLDLLTMCGVIASIVEGFDNGIMLVKAYYYVTTIIFLIHCTLFLWPLVRANEQSLRVNGSLHQLIEKAEVVGSLNSTQGRALHSILQTFIQVSKDKLLMFSGAEILHFTRHFIFTTFTLLISFIVICKEVLQRDEMESKASSPSDGTHGLDAEVQTPHNIPNAVRPHPPGRPPLNIRNLTRSMENH